MVVTAGRPILACSTSEILATWEGVPVVPRLAVMAVLVEVDWEGQVPCLTTVRASTLRAVMVEDP